MEQSYQLHIYTMKKVEAEPFQTQTTYELMLRLHAETKC